MNNKKGHPNQRTHPRFRVKEGAYAVLRPQFTQLGPILDISRGGLAFSYNLTGKPTNGSFELDIFLIGHGVLVERVPFRVISDRKLIARPQHNSLLRRRCGVQFGKLTHSQSQQMEKFMQHLVIPDSGTRRLVGGGPFH